MAMLEFPPTHYEIKEQLERIITSRRFIVATKPSRFLVIAVQRKLKGLGTSGTVITDAIFKKSRQRFEPTNARVTASNLRKLLQKYYASEGREDVVKIALPPISEDKGIKPADGDAYTPTFTYNPELEVAIIGGLAYRSLNCWTHRDYCVAYRNFSHLLSEKPNDLAAILGMVETLCKFADRKWNNPLELDPLAVCNALLERLPPESTNFWRFWAVRATVEEVLGEDERIEPAFAKALALNRAETERYPGYINYLFQAKKMDYALGLANRYLSEGVADANAQVRYAYFMVSAQRIPAAVKHLETVLELDPVNVGAHYVFAFLSFASGRIAEAEKYLGRLRTICDPTSWELIVREYEPFEEQMTFKGWTAATLAVHANVPSVVTELP